MKYFMVSIEKLVPLEKVFPTHLKNLEDMIKKDGFIFKAIIADIKTGIILDGSHRYVFLLKNGYKTAPVYFVDYEDENIRVGSSLKHRFLIDDDVKITKRVCVERAISGNLFSPRTTRHFFPFRKSDISVPLSSLDVGSNVDVSNLIADVEIIDEINHNNGYIDEIDEEVNVIINYLSEVMQTKEYLLKQTYLMSSSMRVGFFPGKFHPPHIGHILTILKLLPKYKKIIIGVTEDTPTDKVTNSKNIVDALKLFFSHFNSVEVVLINGVLTEKTSLVGLPKFDVLLSGNESVIDWGKKHNLNVEYVERSEGFLFSSGTEIRSILNEVTV